MKSVAENLWEKAGGGMTLSVGKKLMKDNEAFLRLISSGGIYWPVSEDIITANSQIEQNEFWK
ncbi:RagB/SusD family nutrient uptake outer membrane protein [Bacteroides thetaiotaomicron]|nr:RagB/SusD family nutrient uptake outer membrane protein [Bacteroides thetaiotaomicron]